MRPIHQRLFAPCLLDMWSPHFQPNPFGNHLIVLDEPSRLVQHLMLKEAAAKKAQQKHRIQVDLKGLSPASIKTELSPDKSTLVVSGKEAETEQDDFFVRELRRTFKLPENVDTEKMTSAVARNGQLVIELPIRQEEKTSEDNGVRMSIELPENVDESKIKVTCRDHDVIVEAAVDEPSVASDSGVTTSGRFYFYRRFTLPKHANAEAVKCVLENRTLTIEAPNMDVKSDETTTKTISIDVKQTPAIDEKNEESSEK